MDKAVLEGEAVDERFPASSPVSARRGSCRPAGAALVEIIRRADARQHVATFIVDRDDGDRNVRPSSASGAVARQRSSIFCRFESSVSLITGVSFTVAIA